MSSNENDSDTSSPADAYEPDEELIGALFGELDDALDHIRETTDSMLESGDYESAINSIFRRVHSIKSNLRMVFLDDLASYTHEFENLLSDIREGVVEAPLAFFPMVLLVMTEICEMAKSSLNGGHIDEPFMVLLTAVEKLKMGSTSELAESSLMIINALEPHDESGYIARLSS